MSKHPHYTRGFTLIEALVAVAILAIAVAGPMYAASRAIVAAQIAKDQLVASYLAQEGVEYVHTMRDNEFLYYYQSGSTNPSGDAWTDFSGAPASSRSIARCKAPRFCMLDPWGTLGSGPTGSSAAVTQCTGNWATCSRIQQKTVGSTPTYTLSGGGDASPTLFTRTIQVETIALNGGQNELKVTSEVHWQSHGIPYTVKAVDHLTAWQ